MITRIKIKNFKMFEDVDIEVGSPVVFVGPNNSGKTSFACRKPWQPLPC